MLLRVRCGCNRGSSVFPAEKNAIEISMRTSTYPYTPPNVCSFILACLFESFDLWHFRWWHTHNWQQQRCGPLSITNSRQSCCHLAHHCLPINFACRCRHPNPENYRQRQIIILFIKWKWQQTFGDGGGGGGHTLSDTLEIIWRKNDLPTIRN